MKTLIFSDTHLTSKVNKKTFNFLENLIVQSDKIIINWDFWDSYKTNFEDFINSWRKKLFSQLLEKQTIYIFWNHDPKDLCNEKVKLFSHQQLQEYIHFQWANSYKLEHWHWYCDFKKNTIKQKAVNLIPRKAVWLWNEAGNMVVNKITKKQVSWNQKLNNFLQDAWLEAKNLWSPIDWYICSHTHTPYIDWENNFINTWSIAYWKASYVIIDDENINLKKERY